MLLLLDDKLLFCVPVCATLQDWWLCVAEASRMILPCQALQPCGHSNVWWPCSCGAGNNDFWFADVTGWLATFWAI